MAATGGRRGGGEEKKRDDSRHRCERKKGDAKSSKSENQKRKHVTTEGQQRRRSRFEHQDNSQLKNFARTTGSNQGRAGRDAPSQHEGKISRGGFLNWNNKGGDSGGMITQL